MIILKEEMAVGNEFLHCKIFRDVGYGSLYLAAHVEKLDFKKVFDMKVGKRPGKFCWVHWRRDVGILYDGDLLHTALRACP